MSDQVVNPPQVAVYDTKDSDLYTISFYGTTGADVFMMEYSKYDRETYYPAQFLQALNYIRFTKATSLITSFSGFIGLAPYTADETKKNENFLWNLKNSGYIDHMTVAFYVKNDDRDKINIKSTIKFGSIDKIGLRSGNTSL